MKKPFLETTWSKVELGDVVLKAWRSLDRIVEVEIDELITRPGLDGKPIMLARVIFNGNHYEQSHDPDETVYVQSRL